MATAVLFMGWDGPRPGSENEAFKYLGHEGREQILTFQKAGWFERHELIGLTPHGGTMNGCIILFGERAKLDELRRTDEFERFSMRMNRLFQAWGVVPGVNWEGIQKVMSRNPDLA